MTTDSSTRTLFSASRLLRTILVVVAAGMTLVAWVVLSEAAWPRPGTQPANLGATSETLTASTPQARVTSTLTIARRAPGGIPVPEGTREFFPKRREGRYGISFQALYETSATPNEIATFFAATLSPEGWVGDRHEGTQIAGAAESGRHLVYRRPGQHLMISLYPAPGGGCEYRVGLVARPKNPAAQSTEL